MRGLTVIVALVVATSASHSDKMCRDIAPAVQLLSQRTSELFDNENNTLLKAVLSDVETVAFNTSALHRALNASAGAISGNEDDLLETLSHKMLDLMTPFDPTWGGDSSSLCEQHTRLYLDRLAAMDIWALKMHDASAKISSGILSGNINQFGDFDECLSIDEPSGQFQGQYCLAYLQPAVPATVKLRKLHDMVQSHGMIKSNFEDPGHRVPRFSTVSWGLCVPSTCTSRDVQRSLQSYLYNFTRGTGIELRIQVDKEMCQVEDRHWIRNLDRGTLTAAAVFLGVILWSIYCTRYDLTHENGSPWMLAFSLRKNNSTFFSTERESSDIEAVHGIRALNAFLLIVSHKSMAILFNPYINRTAMAGLIGQPWTVLARAASLYTDPFIMMSGLLTTYSLMGRLQRGARINVIHEYISRFLRIAPPLGALIAFCTYILPLMGSGPQWTLVVSHHSDICKAYWWRNLMFIHNYFGFENMCLTHTHHVGIDTQLFLTAPILVGILWKWPRKGVMFVLGIAGVSTVARYYVTITRNLSNYVFFGTSVTQLFDTANFMYILPAHRATVYVMGVLLGYVLRKYKDLKFTERQLKWGWIVSIVVCLLSFVGPAPMGSINYQYKAWHAALYAAYAPIGWCVLFGWIILTSHLGYKNIVSDVLSWHGFLVTTRISYAVYLTQFPIFFYSVGITRSAENYTFFSMTINYNEYIWLFVFSYLLTVLFELPFTNLKKLVLPTPKRTPKPELAANHNNNNHEKPPGETLEAVKEKTC